MHELPCVPPEPLLLQHPPLPLPPPPEPESLPFPPPWPPVSFDIMVRYQRLPCLSQLVADLLEFGYQTKSNTLFALQVFFGFAPENRVNLVRNGLLKCPQKSTQLSLSALSSELSLTLLSQLWLLLLLLCS